MYVCTCHNFDKIIDLIVVQILFNHIQHLFANTACMLLLISKLSENKFEIKIDGDASMTANENILIVN